MSFTRYKGEKKILQIKTNGLQESHILEHIALFVEIKKVSQKNKLKRKKKKKDIKSCILEMHVKQETLEVRIFWNFFRKIYK